MIRLLKKGSFFNNLIVVLWREGTEGAGGSYEKEFGFFVFIGTAEYACLIRL